MALMGHMLDLGWLNIEHWVKLHLNPRMVKIASIQKNLKRSCFGIFEWKLFIS